MLGGFAGPVPKAPTYLLIMSSMRFLLCLFCKHPNPEGASFCNGCGSPLHLQPCERCGAIDKRTAATCYKCGGEFPLPAESELSAESLADEIDSALAALDQPLADPPLDAGGVPSGRPAVPESVALALAELRRGVPRADHDVGEPAAEIDVPEATPANDEQTHARPQLPQLLPADATLTSATPYAPGADSGRGWRAAVAALLLVAIAASLYYAYERSAPLPVAAKQAEQPLPASATESPLKADAVSTNVAARLDRAPPSAMTPPAAGRIGVPDKALALAPPAAGAAKPMRARNGTDAAAKPAEAAPTVTGCPEAVDALGLCAANLKQGKQ